jgi:hypothetical protein
VTSQAETTPMEITPHATPASSSKVLPMNRASEVAAMCCHASLVPLNTLDSTETTGRANAMPTTSASAGSREFLSF